MRTLDTAIKVNGRFARSANLERDAALTDPLDGYVVTARALDVVERIATAAVRTNAGGAWSVTGPYGSGKSSLALLLDAAFGPLGDRHTLAIDLVAATSPDVAELVLDARRAHDVEVTGFTSALATANREPVTHTLLRALHHAVVQRFNKLPSRTEFEAAPTLKAAMADADSKDPRRVGPSPAAIIEVARCLAQSAPLIVLVDEFGKNLEAVADSSDADPYLLQQLAEIGQGSAGLPIFVLTLQHLSFADYLVNVDRHQRHEWAKVQGRFEDVAFVESSSQTRALISTVFDITDAGLHKRVNRWALEEAKAMAAMGLDDNSDPSVIASCYPLHPLAAAVLPDLCSRYGQNERTLYSFLAGNEPTSAASFVRTAQLSARGPLPTVGLDALYDYFVQSGLSGQRTSSLSGRWTEIATRLRDTNGLSPDQERTAKSIAVLNLISTGGPLRASRAVLTHADPVFEPALSSVEDSGLITYRDFADEYRIWDGSDIDLASLIERERARIAGLSLDQVLSALDDPSPEVAARHSAEHDVLRIFRRRYVSGGAQVASPDPFSPFDGEVLLVVAETERIPQLASVDGPTKPVLAATPTDVTAVDASAREVLALSSLVDDDSVAQDWVARRELSERIALAKLRLERDLASAFKSSDCTWQLLSGDAPTPLGGGRGTAPISDACDLSYSSTPVIRNEMLNRSDVTSQGSKARRLLLEGMIEQGHQSELGFAGYGPEVAMYRAVVAATGIHSFDARNNTMTFRRPNDASLQPAWDIVQDVFKRAKTHRVNLTEVYATLLSPPFGMKAAVVPVLVTAALLAASDEVALYEHGTFKPLLTPDLSERMVRNPSHFDIKHFANTAGARRKVVDALATEFEVRPKFRKHRVANVLSIVGALVSEYRNLDHYTLSTDELSPEALAVRQVLSKAVEPDELLFASLPEALGFSRVSPDASTFKSAKQFAGKLHAAMDELHGRFDGLLGEIFGEVLEAMGERTRLAVAGQAAALEGEVLDRDVRAFVLTLANTAAESDLDWAKMVATVVARKAPAEWSDPDRRSFTRQLAHAADAFHRLAALHAEKRASSGEPFDALRVAITRADGHEAIRLVGLSTDERADAEATLDEALTALSRLTGSPKRAEQALLAVLGERLLPSRATDDKVTPLQSEQRSG